MQRIGGWGTAEFQFSKDKTQDDTFIIRINGHCQGAFVTESGLYNGDYRLRRGSVQIAF